MDQKNHPLDRLLELEGTRGSAIPYLGYVEVNLQKPGMKGYIPTMTYSEKVPLVVGFKIIDRVMGMITKGELVRVTVTLKQAHFSAVMSRSLQQPFSGTRGNGDGAKGSLPLPPLTLLDLRNSLWRMSRGMSIPHRRLPFLCLGLSIYMEMQMFKGIVHGSMWLLSQHGAPAAHLHGPNHYIWGVTPRLLPSANLFEEPECPPHCDPHQSIGKVGLANQVTPVVIPMEASGESAHGPQKDWIMGEFNLQGLVEWVKEEQDQARKLLVKWEHLFACSNLDLG